MKSNTVIRVGEKNNFGHTMAEYEALKAYDGKGLIFVNSNSFTDIRATYPSIVTVNPYLRFVEPQGDLSNVKAFRVKLFATSDMSLFESQLDALAYCQHKNIPVLITFMRFRSKKTLERYNVKKEAYVWDHNYYRPTKDTQKALKALCVGFAGKGLTRVCDEKGTGCKDCGNCHKLTYGLEKANIKALNLSISGIEDKNGKKGLCPFQCPDCWAKIVNYGKSPACDRLITNLKIEGKVNHI